MLLWEENSGEDNVEQNKNSWLDLSLLKSMFLESICEGKAIKTANNKENDSDILKQDVLVKYNDILTNIKANISVFCVFYFNKEVAYKNGVNKIVQ